MGSKNDQTQPDRHVQLMLVSGGAGGDPRVPGEGLPAHPRGKFNCPVQGDGGQLLPNPDRNHQGRTG